MSAAKAAFVGAKMVMGPEVVPREPAKLEGGMRRASARVLRSGLMRRREVRYWVCADASEASRVMGRVMRRILEISEGIRRCEENANCDLGGSSSVKRYLLLLYMMCSRPPVSP